MLKKIEQKKIVYCLLSVCMLIEVILEFRLHQKYEFVRDDLWYATNLVTGEPLRNITDIFESQWWHYFNWGGRSITHSLLQLILMCGDMFANILNMAATFTLSFLICKVAGKTNFKYFCIAFFLLIALNTDIKQSMFWQSGSVNYLYSTNWILLFLLVYLRQVKEPEAKKIAGIEYWIAVLGLITGWSNENMGPACFIASVIVVLYFLYVLKRKPPVWMWIGAITSLIGSVLVILAPGNFVRSETIENGSIGTMLYERFFMMATGGMSYLFLTLLFIILFVLIYFRTGNKLQPFHVVLMITFVLAYGAMVLSPTFPNRASFGLMVLGIVLIISFIREIEEKESVYRKYISLFAFGVWISGIYILITALRLPL